MKLKIAQIAPIWYSLPPKKYAGIERIVYTLTEELVKRGHKVTLFASGDSKTSAALFSVRKKCLKKDKIPWRDTYFELENLSFAFTRASDYDIIHSHIGLRSLFFQEFVKTPVLNTFHNPFSPNEKKVVPSWEVLKRHKKTTNACFLSKSAGYFCPKEIKNKWTVYNGIDTDFFKFDNNSDNYFVWVGRFDAYKGAENAIEAAEITGIKLYLAGKIDEEKKEYFKKNIKTHLSNRIKYLGELSQAELAELYSKAKALIFPIEWEEPFGLTMVEAQSCGAPVIVFNRGSAKEVVKNKKTGFVVPFLNANKEKNITGIVEAINNIGKIKRTDCRKWVEENFTIGKMADNYEKIYYELVKKN